MSVLSRVKKYEVTMSVEDFLKIPEFVGSNSGQRNTEARAIKANRSGGHLSKLGINHDEVRVSINPNGIAYRTDGNTRAWLWERDLLERPSILKVVVTECTTWEDFDDSYEQVDSESQSKSKADVTYGIMRSRGFVPESPLLAKAKIGVALWVAQLSLQAPGQTRLDHKIDLTDAVTEWIDELELLDTLKISKSNIWYAGTVAGALIALRVYSDKKKVLEFFDKVQRNIGTNITTGARVRCDSVYALRRQQQTGTNGWDKAVTHAGRVLTAVEGYMQSKTYANNADDKPKLRSKNIQGAARRRITRPTYAPVATPNVHLVVRD